MKEVLCGFFPKLNITITTIENYSVKYCSLDLNMLDIIVEEV